PRPSFRLKLVVLEILEVLAVLAVREVREPVESPERRRWVPTHQPEDRASRLPQPPATRVSASPSNRPGGPDMFHHRSMPASVVRLLPLVIVGALSAGC